jgi:DnaJ family protein C protein 28
MEDQKRHGDWEKWIDQQIREALERGEFDNLPGAGKPIDLTPNPHAQGQELAYKVLKDAGLAPEWIELDKAIRKKLQDARAALLRQWQWREARLGELSDRSDSWSLAERSRVEAGWQDVVSAFGSKLEEINQEIGKLNLKVPGSRFQRSMLDLSREVARVEVEAS